MRVVGISVGVLLILCGASSAAASAITIQYSFTNIADVTPGQDRWQGRYRVSGYDFAADQGFAIAFDQTLFAQLDAPPPLVNADWDIITLQPDLVIPSPGVYDALALAGHASLADLFIVSFVWLGGVAGPGVQPFTVNQFDALGNLTILERGATAATAAAGAPIPEPSTLLMLAGGLLCRRRMRRR